MYEIKYKDGTTGFSEARDYKALMSELIEKRVQRKDIYKIWTVVSWDQGYYNRIKKEIRIEKRRHNSTE